MGLVAPKMGMYLLPNLQKQTKDVNSCYANTLFFGNIRKKRQPLFHESTSGYIDWDKLVSLLFVSSKDDFVVGAPPSILQFKTKLYFEYCWRHMSAFG